MTADNDVYQYPDCGCVVIPVDKPDDQWIGQGHEVIRACADHGGYIKAHRYINMGMAGWRTCRICGRGANASIHRSVVNAR